MCNIWVYIHASRDIRLCTYMRQSLLPNLDFTVFFVYLVDVCFYVVVLLGWLLAPSLIHAVSTIDCSSLPGPCWSYKCLQHS